MPTIAVISFPGNNCEVESIRAIERAGMTAQSFRWNADRSELAEMDGYFLVGGFSYEDRGRSGMVAARDPLFDFIGQEAEAGKPVIGNCNGAQVLVESGLIPLGDSLRMSLAHNVVDGHMAGFLNEWIWMKPACSRDRCATSDWDVPMHIPIAHGEGRFTTQDKDLLEELKNNEQLAFMYCDEAGNVSEDPFVTPNGSVYAVAGVCNPAGNVVALMPHPERVSSGGGDPYFVSLKNWIEQKKSFQNSEVAVSEPSHWSVAEHPKSDVEIFIESIITNNEERTVEQAARRIDSGLQLKQMKYLAPKEGTPKDILSNIALFNPNKERAYIRQNGDIQQWDSDSKQAVALENNPLESGIPLVRIDDFSSKIQGGESGICYVCLHIDEEKLFSQNMLEVFCNPHSGTLSRLAV